MTGKMDRRKKYTRMVLKDTLIGLLKTKQLTSITVKEICEIADINRSTFYAHFKDHYDLLNQIEEEIIEDMNLYLSQYIFTEEEESVKMTVKLLEYLSAKKDIFQALLRENSVTGFEKRIMEVAHRFLVKNWLDNSHLDKDVSDYLSTYIISGSVHVIKSWLDQGMKQSPMEMAELINVFSKKGLSIIKD